MSVFTQSLSSIYLVYFSDKSVVSIQKSAKFQHMNSEDQEDLLEYLKTLMSGEISFKDFLRLFAETNC